MPLILIVDDQPDNLTVIGELLQPEHAVRLAGSGAQALRLARLAPRPELILLDVVMPGMDGFEVLRRLRAHPDTAAIPVVLLTALGGPVDEERALAAGAADYISKPVRPAILKARVRCQLELKQARDLLHDRNQWLQAEVARRVGENQMVQDVTIHALARLAEIRDPETANHLRRTQAYVRTLALQLLRDGPYAVRVDEDFVELLVKAAPLHDIGKVGIPDSVLLKPGRLDATEWAVMKTHAALGAEAIAQAERDVAHPLAFLECAKQVARSHHERWDGAGYPDGLAGEAIPLPARVMALADVYDALVSRRPYKGGQAHEQARERILAERGRHFDPVVVDAFAACHAEFAAIAQRLGAGLPTPG